MLNLLDKRGGFNRKVVNKTFFKKWNPSMAYVLGYLFADGSIVDSKPSRTSYLRFYSNDRDVLEGIRDVMDFGGGIYSRKKGGCGDIEKIHYYISIGSREICNDLIRIGVGPRKSKTMSFPDVPDEYLSYFVRGYFDGDGCLYCEKGNKRLRVIFTSGSRGFLLALSKRLAGALGVKDQNVVRSTRSYQIRYSTIEAEMILDYIYGGLKKAPYLRRKFLKYGKWRGC